MCPSWFWSLPGWAARKCVQFPHPCLSQLFKWNLNALLDKFISARIIHIFFIGSSFFRNAICWSTGEICSIFSLYLLKSLFAKPGPIHLLLFLSSHLSFGVKAEGGSFCDPPTLLKVTMVMVISAVKQHFICMVKDTRQLCAFLHWRRCSKIQLLEKDCPVEGEALTF